MNCQSRDERDRREGHNTTQLDSMCAKREPICVRDTDMEMNGKRTLRKALSDQTCDAKSLHTIVHDASGLTDCTDALELSTCGCQRIAAKLARHMTAHAAFQSGMQNALVHPPSVEE